MAELPAEEVLGSVAREEALLVMRLERKARPRADNVAYRFQRAKLVRDRDSDRGPDGRLVSGAQHPHVVAALVPLERVRKKILLSRVHPNGVGISEEVLGPFSVGHWMYCVEAREIGRRHGHIRRAGRVTSGRLFLAFLHRFHKHRAGQGVPRAGAHGLNDHVRVNEDDCRSKWSAIQNLRQPPIRGEMPTRILGVVRQRTAVAAAHVGEIAQREAEKAGGSTKRQTPRLDRLLYARHERGAEERGLR
jgi:hypothetical protein